MTDKKGQPNTRGTSDENLCQKCGRPIKSSASGTITQWITACACDVVDTIPQSVENVELCSTCGKRINTGRAGSLTQWIFKSDSCTCAMPGAKKRPRPVVASPAVLEEMAILEDHVDFISSDRYQASSVLGTGAAGTVFLCRDLLLDRKVAVKCLRLASADQVIQFQQEAVTSSKLTHPNIVTVLDFGADEKSAPYMVMEYVEGVSLEKQIQENGPLDVSQTIHIIKQICEALTYAHDAGVYHRDIKTSNILIDREGKAILIDFGVARMKPKMKDAELTLGITIVGSPNYMAPDQGRGLPYDERSEIYSLGCVLFELVTGAPPFAAETALEVLSLHANKKPPALTDIRQDLDIPQTLEDITTRCLAKEPRERFRSTAELFDALNGINAAPPLPLPEIKEEPHLTPNPPVPRSVIWIISPIIAYLLIILAGCAYYLFTTIMQEREANEREELVKIPHKAEDFGSSDRQDIVSTVAKSDSENIVLAGGFLKDEHLKLLKGHKYAKLIDLTGNQTTDAGLIYLNCPQLQTLKLKNTEVKSLEHIGDIKTLKTLDLAGTNINDAALYQLIKLPKLSELRLDQNDLTDKAIEPLKKIPTLQLVTLKQTDVSPKALDELSRCLPACMIEPDRPARITRLTLETERLLKEGLKLEAYNNQAKAVKLVEDAQGKDAPLLPRLLLGLSTCAAKLGKDDEAKQLLERALVISRRTDNERATADGLRGWRMILVGKGKLKEGIKLQEQICALSEKLEMPDSKRRGDDLLEQGQLYQMDGQFEKALLPYMQALKILYKKKSFKMAQTLVSIGIIENELKKYDDARGHLQEAAQIILEGKDRDSVNSAEMLATIYSGVARTYVGTGNSQEALASFDKALEIATRYGFKKRTKLIKERIAALEARIKDEKSADVKTEQLSESTK